MEEKLELLGKSYSIIDKRNNITLADSFVSPPNKIGTASGEAKLYIGKDGDNLREFYGLRKIRNKCFLLKEDLIRYLYECKDEYYHPTQPYRSQMTMAQLWEKRMNKVELSEDVIWFTMDEQEQIELPRIYIKSFDSGYTFIRELSLPNLTFLSIVKLRDQEDEIVYYYKIYMKDHEAFDLDEVHQLMSLSDGEEEKEGYDDEGEKVTVVLPLTAVEDEIEEFRPYDTEKISIDTKGMLLEACLRRMEQGTIILSPDFQRNEVWTIEKRSKLIESILLKIPIPMFYVSSDEKGTYSVVDGLQRLSTIRDFVLGNSYLKSPEKDMSLKGNGFHLEKLEFWGDKFNGYTFNQLPIDMQNRILETEFTFTIINPGTPEEVKRNIFKRINTGGEPLTSQEIRNALYAGQSTEFLKRLASQSEFDEATFGAVKEERMMDKELILRSLSFMIRNYTSYPKSNDMDKFLSDTMRIMNIMPDLNSKEASAFFREEEQRKEGVRRKDILITDTKSLEIRFRNGMIRAHGLFDKHTFRKSYGKKRRTPINKALFEVWTVLLSDLTDIEYKVLLSDKRAFLSEYNRLLDDNSFNYIISRDSLKYNSVQERYKQLSLLLKKHTI